MWSSSQWPHVSHPRLTLSEHPHPSPRTGTFGADWVCDGRSHHHQDQQLVPAAGHAVGTITCSLLHPHIPPKPQDSDHNPTCGDLRHNCLNHRRPVPSSLASPKTHPAVPWYVTEQETWGWAATSTPCYMGHGAGGVTPAINHPYTLCKSAMLKMYGANYQGSLPGVKFRQRSSQSQMNLCEIASLLPFIGQYKYFTVI